jgi:hypothetical protein
MTLGVLESSCVARLTDMVSLYSGPEYASYRRFVLFCMFTGMHLITRPYWI